MPKYPQHRKQSRHVDDAKDGEITRLRKAIRRLQSDKQKLLSEVRTIQEAFEKNVKFLKGVTKDLTVGELIDAAKKDLTLKDAQLSVEENKQALEDKWKCYTCSIGVMRLLIFNNREGTQYFRKCSNQKCSNRTKPQPYNEFVEGIK